MRTESQRYLINLDNQEISSNSTVGTKGKTMRKRRDNDDDDDDDDEQRIIKGKRAPFYKLFSFADSTDLLLMIGGTIGAIAHGAAMPLMILIFGDVINSFGQNQKSSHNMIHQVSNICLVFLYLGVGAAVAAFLQVSCWMVTGERQAARIRRLYLKAILQQDVTFFDLQTNTGEVVARMSGDTVVIQDAMGEQVGKFLQLVSTFVACFVVGFVKGWLLTLVMTSTIPLVVIAGGIMSRIISKVEADGQKAYATAVNLVEQTIGSIRTVASFTGEKQAINNYHKFLVNAYKSSTYEGFAAGAGLGVVNLIMFSSYGLAVWFGGKMILDKGYSGGDVLSVMIAVLSGSMSLGQASPCMSAFAAGQVAAAKMFETIERKAEIDAYDTKGKVLENIRGDIELKDVYFSYPSRLDEHIFSGFSLIISSGSTTALVGQSGSGKSTVISLIERFYDPQAGEVLIDGNNLKEYQLKWIRSKIGLVSQEPILFTCSIRDNIAYGKESATTEEIRDATELANATNFIDKLPQGLDTMVGEHGTQLSGGQKQRIAIARAILRDSQILLLDEATSALDAESERMVQEALDMVMVNRTTVIVAHRLSTVKNADVIVVIQGGKVVEKGSHNDLLKDSDGAYSKLIGLQDTGEKIEHVSDEQRETNINTESFQKSPVPSISRGSPTTWLYRSPQTLSLALGLPSPASFVSSPATDTNYHVADSSEKALKVSIRRVASLNKPEIPVLVIGSVAAIANGVIFPLYGMLISNVIGSFYKPPHELKKDTTFWALMFVSLGFASCFISPFQQYLFSVAGGKLIKRIRSMCFEKVLHMEVSWFDEPQNSSGAIGARLSADAASIRALVGDALALLVQNMASMVAGLVIAFIANWKLALVVLTIIPLVGVTGYIQSRFMQGFSEDTKLKYEEVSQVAADAVRSIRTVASFCAEEKVMQLYRSKCEVPLKSGIKQGFVSGIGFGVAIFLLFSVFATIMYTGAQFVQHGQATFKDIFQVFFALVMAMFCISQTSSLAPDSTRAKGAAASIFTIIDRKSKIDPSDDLGQTLLNVRGEIQLRHVSFKYPSRPDVQILKRFNLTIPAGKTVALVGESGSGKSTVISLLQRFYDLDSGNLTLDGVPVQKLQLKWLRQQMGLVSQEPVLFSATIRDNIAYGKPDGKVTESEIIAAAELANAHNFISTLQQGYETMVGERGVQLSGGQKQRVAIARALLKSPKILLLDEATSALDTESEHVVQDALDQVMVNRTTVLVAHRLSTIKNADVIAVMKRGVVVEKGNHDTLINVKNGFYASLIALHMTASKA